MNVKFKMPKFGRALTMKSWLKELLLTFLGTTISIVLTFGTSHWLDHRQKKAAGRQMAMMVIHDIDDGVQLYRNLMKNEKDYLEVTQYVMNNLNQLDSIPGDSLVMVYYYLLHDVEYTIDDSKEKIFHSSPETWKSIDNSKFLDIVQEFYHERRDTQNELNTDPAFTEPISMEEHFENVLATEDKSDLEGLSRRVLAKKLKDPRVQLFILYSSVRQSFYEKVANNWQQKSDQCKFLMGITDEELKEYVEKNNRMGRPVKEGELVGKWSSTSTSASEDYTETMEFMKDHTFVHKCESKNTRPFFTGSIDMTLVMPGKWSLEGDTLVRTYLPGAAYTLDASTVTYTDEMKDSAQSFIKHNEDRLNKMNEEYKTKPKMEGRRANFISIDRSGNKIEWIIVTTNEEGEETSKAEYLSRMKK